MNAKFARRYRDPVYGYIYVPHELIELADSAYVARLRRISQNGCGHLVYPSLTGNRYEHALGVMHLAMKAWDYAWANSSLDTKHRLAMEVYRDLTEHGADPYFQTFLEHNDKSPEEAWVAGFSERMRACVGAAGLLHDVGHSPFSHTLEPEFSSFRGRIFDESTLSEFEKINEESPALQFHEICGQILSTHALEQAGGRFSAWVTQQIIQGSRVGVRQHHQWASAIHSIISGSMDVDRLDYLMRDSSRAGTEFGAIDVERLIESMSIQCLKEPDQEWIIGFGARAVSAIETLLTNRERAYRWVYFHANALAADTALRRLIHALFSRDQFDLRQFDYVSLWADEDTYGGSAWVDDAAIVRFIGDALKKLEAVDQDAARLQALYRLAVSGDRSVLFAWRSFEELIAAFDAQQIDWQMRVLQQAKDASAPVVAGAPKRTWDASEQATAAAFNELARLRLDDNPDAELALESLLNERHGKVDGVPGTWIVTHRIRFSFKSSRFLLWHDGRQLELSRLSPSASGLDKAESMRIKVWACFMPMDRTSYQKDGRADLARSVAHIFLSEFMGPSNESVSKSEIELDERN